MLVHNSIMVAYTLICALLAFTAVRNGYGFIFNDKADCSISQWSAWSTPHGSGVVFRDRSILRYPSGGGQECDVGLVDAKDIELPPGSPQHFKPLPLQITASLLIDKFLRPALNPEQKRNTDTSNMFRDLLIIMDSSGSIGQSEFNTSLGELTDLLGKFCPVLDPFNIRKNRAAFIEFSTNAYVLFDFDANANTTLLFSAIRNVQYRTGGTNTGNAFNKANSMFTTARGARESDRTVKPEVLIITDGMSDDGYSATQAARKLQETADVYALTLGVNSIQGAAEMATYVTRPLNNHLFAIPSHQDLTDLVKWVKAELNSDQQHHCAPFISNS